MEAKQTKKLFMMAVFSVLLALLLISGATYAWFTANKNVNTNIISSRTLETSVELQLSTTGGDKFNGKSEVAITQVNTDQDKEVLMPVSTDDLEYFIFSPTGEDFTVLEKEEFYYHGRIYLKAVNQGAGESSSLDVYLENIDKMLKADKDSLLLNASRMGLKFSDGTTRILSLSKTRNDAEDRINNTMLGGSLQSDGKVLHSSNGVSITAVNDPSEYAGAYDIDASDSEPLINMAFNKVYTLDIYFYLEGCDSDCSDAVMTDGATINLQFYGVLKE